MIIKDISIYDGSQLQERFAYHYFGNKIERTGNIIAFVAPMKVEADFMVDKEDLKNKDYIYSESSMQFLIEIPDIDAFAGVCFQRLFNTELANLLSQKINLPVCMKGDDILVGKDKMKASVSIAKPTAGAILIHTAINIEAGEKAPSYAFSTKLEEKLAYQFMEEACINFKKLSKDIFVATTKIRSI